MSDFMLAYNQAKNRDRRTGDQKAADAERSRATEKDRYAASSPAALKAKIEELRVAHAAAQKAVERWEDRNFNSDKYKSAEWKKLSNASAKIGSELSALEHQYENA